MARNILKSKTAIAFIVCIMCLLITLIQSQEFNQFDEQCGGCWNELDYSVNTIVRSLAKNYRHKAKDEIIDEDNEALSLIRGSPHEIFRRSTSTSTNLECRACWVVLNRLKSEFKVREETEVTDYGRLVKKTMLNNGW
uniref:Saposin B-type domain-containing protein n=1 Tax=Arion vulgaris TaxID=1028688 RepID=A0A0B7BUM3_9EUPU